MHRINLVESSIYHKLQYTFKATLNTVQLSTQDNKTYFSPKKNLLPLEVLKVYKNGIEQSTGFTVYYPDGKIVFDVANQATDIITLDTSYCYVNLDISFQNEFSLPKIVIDFDENIDFPLEIGSKNRRIDNYYVDIIVYSERYGSQKDYLNIIKDNVRSIPIIDFNQGFPINSDGTKNSSFVGPIVGYLDLDKIILRNLGYAEVVSDKYAYVGIAECVFVEYLT